MGAVQQFGENGNREDVPLSDIIELNDQPNTTSKTNSVYIRVFLSWPRQEREIEDVWILSRLGQTEALRESWKRSGLSTLHPV